MQIADYHIEERLYQGRKFQVYRAWQSGSAGTEILKTTIKHALQNEKALQALRREYELLQQIESGAVAKALDWAEDDEHAALVLEDIQGRTLSEELGSVALSMERFLELAVQIVTGLAAIHQKNIIHKDINPSNIILNPQTGALQIIDFDISSTYDLKTSHLSNPEILEGTLPYLSPEQTGRMNRSVDQRSDLYSLGVTFYEMLSGQRPFTASDPMELVYAHLAKMPVPPVKIPPSPPLEKGGEEILPILSDITMKLLAKEPAERYQSAEGLKYDLEQLQHINLTGLQDLSGFEIATRDFSGKLQIPEKLYGREGEIEQLLDAYQRAAAGAKELLLVAGYSGIGKTALANALHTPVTGDRGSFLSGKFDQLQRSIPYSALIQALTQFCHYALSERPEALAHWKDEILEAVEGLGKALTDLIPPLEAIVGPQPDLPEVGGEEARKRLYYVFRRFIQAIASPDHPLVIFLDDLQWADLPSLQMLQAVMEDRQHGYLLLIGAYRDNEVSPAHPLMATLENLQQQDIAAQTMTVKELPPEHVQTWLGETFGSRSGSDAIQALTAHITAKTRGNPFFTIQFLFRLYEDGLVRFDAARAAWTWRLAAIEQQQITDNVVDLLAQKIRSLPPDTQDVLTLASGIGHVFQLETLSAISGLSQEGCERALQAALKEHLVFPTEDAGYRFAHDRIHQAAYATIAEADKLPLHLKIGRLLLKTRDLAEGETEPMLFDIVNHLNIGNTLIADGQERQELVRLNLHAAQQAKRSGAYNLALEYAQQARRNLPEESWQQQYALSLAVSNEIMQLCYLNGEFEETERQAQHIMQRSVRLMDNATAYEYRMLNFIAQNLPQKTEAILLETLALLGMALPETLSAAPRFDRLGEEEIRGLPLMSDPQSQLILRLCAAGITGLMHASQELIPRLVDAMLDLTMRAGLSPESPYMLSMYGTMKNFMGDTNGAYRLGKLALELANHIPHSENMQPKAVTSACFYQLGWKEHFKDVAQILKKNYHAAMQVGDIEYAAYSIGLFPAFLSRTETELSTLKDELQVVFEALLRLKQPIASFTPRIEASVIPNLLGEHSHPAFLALSLDDFPPGMPAGVTNLVSYAITIKKVFLAYLFDDATQMLDYLQVSEDNWKSITIPVTIYKSDFHFYRPLAYIRLAEGEDSDEGRQRFLEPVRESLPLLKEWAEFGPLNFEHKYHIMQAEFDRLNSDVQQAAEHYDRAIAAAYQHDYIHEAGIANELAARCYLQQGREPLAEFYFRKARECYQKWGAVAKVKHLEERYPKYLRQAAASEPSRGTSSTGTTAAALDIHTILKATRALSGAVQLKSLLENMLRIVLENAGAQRGLFLEPHDATFLIQAAGSMDGVTDVLAAVPAENSNRVPLSLINYAARSKERLVFDNLSKDATYRNDPYVRQHQPQSAACVPVLKQGELSAILYLENNAVEGAFTPARLEMLNMLSAQIAISIENAELYENLEEKVQQRTAELRQAHSELEEAHTALTDNVNYASRIQQAVLPESERMAELFPEHFILYKPHSVVSGDFYWMRELDGKIIVAAVDCTGHGVSGALVSMLGTAFLNEIVPSLAAQSRLAANTVLDELRENVKTAFKQEGVLGEQKEGMDMALCILDPANQQLQFAGAYNPLYLIRNGELIEAKADRMPIGIYRREQPFTKHDLAYQPGDMLYLFSDGFTDQHSETGKGGFSKKRFRQLLLDIHQEPAVAQQDHLKQAFEEWKGALPQTDDVLVVGIRL